MAEDGIDLEAELDRLYGLPAGEFVAARNELAKRLRKAGDRDAAEKTKKLAKPSVTAWAVNQLAFRAGSELEGLRAAGEKVRAAHLAGLKEQQAAASARRDAISTLRVIAEVALQEAGVSPNRGHRQRISQTLEVLSSQGSEADQPRAGRLATDLEPAGFDALSGLAGLLAASQKARPPAPPKPEPAAAWPAALAPVAPVPVAPKPVVPKLARPKPAAPKPAAPKPARPKVVEHPSSTRQADPVARQAAVLKAAERHQLDGRRQRAQGKLEQLEEKLAGLSEAAERATSALAEAKRAEASMAEAAREAARLAAEARARVEAAAGVTAKARREAESASGAERRAQTAIEKARQELADVEAARGRLDK